MAVWSKESCVITAGGKNLLAKLTAGKQLEIVQVVCGSNTVEIEMLEQQTEIQNVKKELEFRKIVDVTNNMSTFICYLKNTGVTEAFALTQIGIYAKNPDNENEKILYCIMQVSQDEDIIPTETSMNNFVETFILNTLFENETGFSVTLDPLGMTTEEEFQQLLLDFINLHTDFAHRVIGETGTVNLTNSQEYPFNNSVQTVSLQTERLNTNYEVFPEVISSTGTVKNVYISDKQVNGFKIKFTGSATAASIRYVVRGGMV